MHKSLYPNPDLYFSNMRSPDPKHFTELFHLIMHSFELCRSCIFVQFFLIFSHNFCAGLGSGSLELGLVSTEDGDQSFGDTGDIWTQLELNQQVQIQTLIYSILWNPKRIQTSAITRVLD